MDLMIILYQQLKYLMFLQKYRSIRRLGKGAYGDVHLVEDEQGTRYALKLISIKKIESQPHLRDYLEGEIQCMKQMNSKYIIKLYDNQEDADDIYLLLEYCDGGDLMNCQARLKQRVFSIEKATQILAEVIIGLEQLHQQGYLHRDIKPQNVLIKTENGKQIYKLADFGFSKKKAEVGGTILGTEQYMSPEVYGGQDHTYGFQVDMWAFGVLFYFMLNLDFPFKLNNYWEPERKEVQLRKLAKNFSYSAAVKESKKKLVQNCNPQLEDLFKKMFELDVDQRITFSDIRRHPVFVKHFPIVAEASKILYSKKFQPSAIIKKSVKAKPIEKKGIEQQDNIRGTISIIRKKDKNYPVEKQVLQRKKDQLDFLKDNAQVFYEESGILKPHEKLMLSYNLFKYYIVLLKNFKQSLNAKDLSAKYPGLKWNEYLNTKEYKEFIKQVEEDLSQTQVRFSAVYDQCFDFLKEISEINSKFQAAFNPQINEKDFQGSFKQSYRKSTIYIFGVLREVLKNKTGKKGNKLNYILSLLVISHAFNNFFSDLQNLSVILKEYLEEKKSPVQKLNYSDLRQWMSHSKQASLNNIAKLIIKIYFSA